MVQSLTSRMSAALIALFVAFFAVILVPSPAANAADIAVQGCEISGAPASVTVDTDDLGPFEGGWLPLHDVVGAPFDYTDPVGTFNDIPPICVVPVSGGLPVEADARWAWCLQVFNHVCAEAPLEESSYAGVLDADQAALVAWRAGQFEAAGDSSISALEQTQLNIWCITDDYQYPGPITWWGAPVSVTTCAEYRTWLNDTVLTGFATADDTITVVGPSGSVRPGNAQEFFVTSTLGVLDVAVSGGTMAVCPGASGATLTSGVLTTTTPGSPVPLCVTSDDVGTVTLTASSSTVRPVPATLITATLPSFDGKGCQVFFADTAELPLLGASATADYDLTPELAATGFDLDTLRGLLLIAALSLLAGIALVAWTRCRQVTR